MMKILKATVISLAIITFNSFAGQVYLSEKPIKVGIPLNEEVIVKFPDAVTHTKVLHGADTSKFRQFLTPDGVLYLSTDQEFDNIRMVAELVSGKIVVMDMRSEAGPHGRNIEIVKQSKPKKSPVKKAPVKRKKSKENPNKPAFLKYKAAKTKSVVKDEASTETSYVEMTQYAFRHFVGPSRLIGRPMGKSVKLSNKNINRFVRGWKSKLSIKPLKQWRVNNKYITVLLVNNISNSPVNFDPRALRGRIEFAAALNPVISSQGSINDRTLWAVITSMPFNRAIQL